jgi:Xaa-Pro aminopeptidase
VVCSNPFVPRSGDQYYPYRQHSDFFYLTGITQDGSILVISQGRETLFIKKPDRKQLIWSGPLLSPEQASVLSGIGDVRWTEELDTYLKGEGATSGTLLLNHSGVAGGAVELRTPASVMSEKLERLFPEREQRTLAPQMAQLRMVKEPEELEMIRRACEITCRAFFRAVKQVRPGAREYEIEAELTAELLRNGASGNAFEPIVASGKNALILHYVGNSGICSRGELLLMDFGAEVNLYAADCSRTIPVQGNFSRRQWEIYDAVHRIFLQARSMMVPGTRMGDFHDKVGSLWEQEHIKLGLYSADAAKANPDEEPLWKSYYIHGTAHSLGLDVHDPFDRAEPFRANMVFSCEPAVYIPEEGIGIRLEDTILITEGGPVDLMEGIPMEAAEIEKLMQQNETWR